MPNQELISYIKGEQQKGLDKTTIVNSLLNVGWQQTQIDEAFAPISPQIPLPQQTPITQQAYDQTKNSNSEDSPKLIQTKKSKTGMVIGLFIVILIFLGLFATVLFAYDKLPIKNSDLQNKIVNVLMSIPFMPKTPRFVLESSANAHLKVTRFSFDTSIATDSNSLNYILGTSKFDAQITGKIDYANIKKPLAQVNARITKDLSLDFRTKDQIIYFRINEIPAMVAVLLNNFGFTEEVQKQVFDKWLFVDTTPLNTDARTALDDSQTDEKSTIQQGFKNYLDAFNNQDVLKSLSMKEEKTNNIDTYHINFAPDDKMLDVFWDKYTKKEQNKTKNSYSSNYKISDTLKKLVVDIWIDKSTYFIQKSSVRFNIKSPSNDSSSIMSPLGMFSPQEQDVPISISVKLSDFNKPVEVSVPKDAVKFEDLIKSLMPQMEKATAFDPAKQFSQANNTQRASNVNAILNSVNQYMADHKGSLPAGITTTVRSISSTGANLCAILVPEYLSALPVDPLINNGTSITKAKCSTEYITGYTIVRKTNNRITVAAPKAELDVPVSVTR